MTTTEKLGFAADELEAFLRSLPDGESNYHVSSAALAIAEVIAEVELLQRQLQEELENR